jgi:hypothetical protein
MFCSDDMPHIAFSIVSNASSAGNPQHICTN